MPAPLEVVRIDSKLRLRRVAAVAVASAAVAVAACGHATPLPVSPTGAVVVRTLNLETGQPCFLNGDCASGFCDKRIDDCAGNGACADVPRCAPTNPAVDFQACGCDGRTYENECRARERQVSVRVFGACPAPP